MILCNFLAAGPTLAIVQTAQDFFPNFKETGLESAIAKTAYFFNCTALFQGLGNLFWMPIITKYGRRPAYVTAFSLYTITAIWCAVGGGYANFLVARIFMGIAAGAGECLAPITIADIFFLHERGAITAYVFQESASVEKLTLFLAFTMRPSTLALPRGLLLMVLSSNITRGDTFITWQFPSLASSLC